MSEYIRTTGKKIRCKHCNKYFIKTFKREHCSDKCTIEYRNYRRKTEPELWITKKYYQLIDISNRKNHPPVNFSKEEFKNWVKQKNNLSKLKRILKKYIKSNFNKWDSPSINRLNNYKGYQLDNIEITTWRRNYRLRSTSPRFLAYMNRDKK